jgi:hypothetical protein
MTAKPKGKRSARKPKQPQIACAFDGCDRRFKTERGARQHERTCEHKPAPPEPDLFYVCTECREVVRPGPIEANTRRDIDALISTHKMGEALAETAFNLARALDQGAGLATAAIARELRATLTELAKMGVDDDDLDDRLSTPV